MCYVWSPEEYGLQDRVNGKVIHGTKPGPKPYLSTSEETELSQFLIDVAEAGYEKTRSQVLDHHCAECCLR